MIRDIRRTGEFFWWPGFDILHISQCSDPSCKGLHVVVIVAWLWWGGILLTLVPTLQQTRDIRDACDTALQPFERGRHR